MISKNIMSFCIDYTKIENYNKAIADTSHTWECHHIMEQVFTKEALIRAGWYYDRPPEEFIFLTKAEHTKLHLSFPKRKERARQNRIAWNKAHSGIRHPKEWKEKQSKSHIGLYWWNNGVTNIQSRTQPEGFVRGRIVRWSTKKTKMKELK